MTPHAPFTAICCGNEEVAQDTRKLSFEIIGDGPKEFASGQFFLFEADPKTHRAYSIASSPADLPRFDLLVKLVEGGAASEQLRNLAPKDEVTVCHDPKRLRFIEFLPDVSHLKGQYRRA